MTAVIACEDYSAHHSESFNEILEWPYRRFLKAFEAFQRRRLSEEIDQKRNLHVAALYSNTNYDDEKADRQGVITKVEEFYDLLKESILIDPKEKKEHDNKIREMEDADPFLKAGKRNLEILQMPGQDSIENLPE